MTISFCNKGRLDLATVTTMGVSVKQTDTPIGFFGTGLKFAIATLLRTGHEVEIVTGGTRHRLTSTPTQIRGESFDVVCLDDQPLGYTTQLGRSWEPWQAYRELSSNARDEQEWLVTDRHMDGDEWDTIIQVTGDGIEAAHRERDTIFCSSFVRCEIPGLAQLRDGESAGVFYRGVRVLSPRNRSRITWNVLQTMELTEDRTLKHWWGFQTVMGRTIARCDSYDLVLDLLTCGEDYLEHEAEFSGLTVVSDTFMRVMRERGSSTKMNVSARKLFLSRARPEEVFRRVSRDALEQRFFEEACRICLVIDPDFQTDPIFVSDLGENILGCVRDGQVYIARGCLTRGVDMLAGTLYEEYLHLHHSMDDESRSMQNHLINQLVRLGRRSA